MTTSRQQYLDSSINASMSDFEAREFSPTIPDIPSQHSGFRSPQNSEYSDSSRNFGRSISPPAWRKASSGWFHNQTLRPHGGGYTSKEVSPQYISAEEEADDGDVTAYRNARRIPLPESPTKGRSPTNSPEPATAGGAADGDHGGAGTSTVRQMSEQTEQAPESPSVQTPTQNNCK
jgi:hypothetical protein